MRVADGANDCAISKSVFEISATGMKESLETSYRRSNFRPFIAFLLVLVIVVFGILGINAVKKKRETGFVSVKTQDHVPANAQKPRGQTPGPAHIPRVKATSNPISTPLTNPTRTPPSRTPTIAPITTPTTAPLTTQPISLEAFGLDELRSLLIDHEVSNHQDLYNESSSQFRAVEWLAKQNNPDPVSFPWIQERYIVAAIFFANDGINWKNQCGFLDDTSICDWHSLTTELGIYCSPQRIILSKLFCGNWRSCASLHSTFVRLT